MSLRSIRRENISYLINLHGTQTRLAEILAHETLTQPIISSILRGKRPLRESEARYIEQKVGIPKNWIDKYPLRAAWRLLIRFRRMSEGDRETVNEILSFIEVQKAG